MRLTVALKWVKKLGTNNEIHAKQEIKVDKLFVTILFSFCLIYIISMNYTDRA